MPQFAPQLTVFQPVDNLNVKLNQPFLVTGQVTDQGMPEPHLIDSVMVQVDSAPAIDATLTIIPDHKVTRVSFKAFAQVMGGSDPHAVTITATNDQGASASQSVSVFTGPVFQVDTPSLLVELAPMLIDPADPAVPGLLELWASQMQQAMLPLSQGLASAGLKLIGPNFQFATNALGATVLRVGLWIEDPSFPALPAEGSLFPLPRLSQDAATACFELLPLLSLPDPSGLSPAFGMFVPLSTLQHLADAVFPAAKASVPSHISLDSVNVITSAPATIITSFSGSAYDIGFSANITEVLGTKSLAGADPAQNVPTIISNSYSTSLGSVLDWVVGTLFPIFDLLLFAMWAKLSSTVGDLANQFNGAAGALLAGIPPRILVSNSEFGVLQFPVPDFPAIVLDWRSLGVSDAGILGLGTTTILARQESDAAINILGASRFSGYQQDFAGGALQGYTTSLINLAPDSDKFTWQVSGHGSDGGVIPIGPLSQTAAFGAFFPLPLPVNPGDFAFTLTVVGTETCGTDKSKTLTASASKNVDVKVLKGQIIPQKPAQPSLRRKAADARG